MRLIYSILLIFFLLTPHTYGATKSIPFIPDSATVVHLKESAYKRVIQDKARATIRIETQSGKTTEVKSFIEDKVNKTLAIAKDFPKVSIIKGRYALHRQYNPKSKRQDLWIGSQSLVMDSYSTEQITHLIGRLEELDLIGTVQYYLSEGKQSDYKDDLIAKAMKAIHKRAKKMAKQLKYQRVHIAEVTMESAVRYAPYSGTHRILAQQNMMASAPSPVASQKDEIGITVSAVVYLIP
jgi:predicted secreted protein